MFHLMHCWKVFIFGKTNPYQPMDFLFVLNVGGNLYITPPFDSLLEIHSLCGFSNSGTTKKDILKIILIVWVFTNYSSSV